MAEWNRTKFLPLKHPQKPVRHCCCHQGAADPLYFAVLHFHNPSNAQCTSHPADSLTWQRLHKCTHPQCIPLGISVLASRQDPRELINYIYVHITKFNPSDSTHSYLIFGSFWLFLWGGRFSGASSGILILFLSVQAGLKQYTQTSHTNKWSPC